MHELSLCDDLLGQVIAIAADNKAQAVASITVQCGPLSGVEPLLLDSAFAMVKVGTIAEQAELIIQSAPVIVQCQRCGEQSEASANHLICTACNSPDTLLISGNQLILASIGLDCAV
ncbi:MAG: hydrogenase maturation nickel metallochaperone HypA [Methylococcales bacterium]|nr:hydrogenase maturation nickel metallochaperone HypA [Methylococcales bacterium]